MPNEAGAGRRFRFLHIGMSRSRLLGFLAAASAAASVALYAAEAGWSSSGAPDFLLLRGHYFVVLGVAAVLMALSGHRLAMASQLFGIFWATLVLIGLFWAGFLELRSLRGSWLSEWILAYPPVTTAMAARPIPFTSDYLFKEIVNASILLCFPLVAAATGLLSQKLLAWTLSSTDNRPHWIGMPTLPSVNNATFANAAGWIAILFPVGLLSLLLLLQDREPVWVLSYLSAFPWFLAVAPVLCLGLAVQREPPDVLLEFEARLAAEQPARPSVRPLFDQMVAATPLRAELRHEAWRELPESDRSAAAGRQADGGRHEAREARRRQDVEDLLAGAMLTRVGNLDAELLRMILETVKSLQDGGEATILLCPDGSGDRIFQHLKTVSGFDFPDIVRKIEIWRTDDRGERRIDPFKILDMVVAEQTAFLDIVLDYSRSVRGEFLDNLLRRTGLFVALDFHAVDASLLLLTLQEMNSATLPNKVGFLVQMRSRQSMDSQLLGIRTQIPSGNTAVRRAQTRPVPVEIGTLWFFGSDEMRRALIAYHNYPPVTRDYKTEAYFALAPRRQALPAEDLPIFFLQAPNEPPLFEALEARMRGTQQFGDDELIRRRYVEKRVGANGTGERDDPGEYVGSSYVPATDVRICVVSDIGNVFDCLGSDYAFWAGGDDYLSIVVSEGYPGRRYLLDLHDEGNLDREAVEELLCPMAQEPGIGITDVANRLMQLLGRPEGLGEDDVRRILSIASGRIGSYIGVSATRRGLATLFNLASPGQARDIEMTFDTSQNTTFKLQRSGREVLAEPKLWVREEGRFSRRIALVPLADEGLLFCEDHEFRFGKERMSIVRVSRGGENAIVAKALDRNAGAGFAALRPGSRHFFERHYEILAREGDGSGARVQTFVGESTANVRLFGRKLYCAHVHVGIARVSTDILSISTDAEPTLTMKNVRLSTLGRLIRHRRPFRGVTILVFEDPGGEFQDDAVLHATLAASLQVVLGLGFPALRERIAVVPIGGPALPGRDGNRVFRCLFPTGAITGDNAANILKRLYEVEESAELEHHPGLQGPLLSLAVIEDAAHDLGVARRIRQDINDVVARWKRFLDWAADQEDWNVAGLLDAGRAAAFPGLETGAGGGHG